MTVDHAHPQAESEPADLHPRSAATRVQRGLASAGCISTVYLLAEVVAGQCVVADPRRSGRWLSVKRGG